MTPTEPETPAEPEGPPADTAGESDIATAPAVPAEEPPAEESGTE